MHNSGTVTSTRGWPLLGVLPEAPLKASLTFLSGFHWLTLREPVKNIYLKTVQNSPNMDIQDFL